MSKGGFRIIFMGTPDFAVPSLKNLLTSKHRVVAVVTQTDKKKGRGKKLSPPPVKVVAEEADIPVLQPTKIISDDFYHTLNGYSPDLIVVVAYGKILPAPLLELPRQGCINVHGSLLPKYRGAAPIQWSIIRGERETGVTIMQMNEGMDTGDILLPAAIQMDDNETAGSLFEKLAAVGAETLMTALDRLLKGDLPAQEQDHTQATMAPPLKKEMGRIDWNKPAEELHCLIRGLDPWPSAYTFLDGIRYRLFAPKVVHKKSEEPAGTILLADKNGLLVATGKEALLIGELQPEGRKRLSVEAFLCGHSIENGNRFTSDQTT